MLKNIDEKNENKVEIKETEYKLIIWDIQKKIQNLAWQNCISKSIVINQFLNPKNKNVDDNLKVSVDKISKPYNIGNNTYKIDKKDIIIFWVEYSKIMKFFRKFLLYEK